MIAIYDERGSLVPLVAYDDYCITHKQDGNDTLSFCIDPELDQYKLLREECVVVTDSNEWLIKKIDDDRIDCELNFDQLKRRVYANKKFSKNITQMLEEFLPDGWTIQGDNIPTTNKTFNFDYGTEYDIISACMAEYEVYPVWNIKNKTVKLCDPNATIFKGEYLTTELNLERLSFNGDTTDFATRLYAFGADGLSIARAKITDSEGNTSAYGLPYVEDRSYVDKTVCAYWVDERYTNANSLYEAALNKIATMSRPVRSYQCDVVDIAKLSEKYGFLEFNMHDKIAVIDVDRGIRIIHQIVEYKEYPDEPHRNKITIQSVPKTIQSKIRKIQVDMTDRYSTHRMLANRGVAAAIAAICNLYSGHIHIDKEEGVLIISDNEIIDNSSSVWKIGNDGVSHSSTGINGVYSKFVNISEMLEELQNAISIQGPFLADGSVQISALSPQAIEDIVSLSASRAVDSVDSQITSMSTDIDDANTQIGNINASITNLQTSISEKLSVGTVTTDDINDIETGVYFCSAETTNLPVAEQGYIEVLSTLGLTIQKFTTESGDVYIRSSPDKVNWTEWKLK